jgi:hypothetical protein
VWPRRAANAFIKLVGKEDVDAQGAGIALLADIRQIFESRGLAAHPSISSSELVKSLHEMGDGEWAEWGRMQRPITATQLARLLRRYNIKPRLIRNGPSVARSYCMADFKGAFDRYLPATGVTPELNFPS